MIHKKLCICVSVLILCMFLNLPAKKKEKYEHWIKEEVNLIITDAEKDEFKQLKKDKDKEFFIKLFWAKRDPTPQTEKNEFKEEYYRRLNYVKNAFIYGYKTGIKTDMGKVYLYFGKPKIFPQGKYRIWVYPTLSWMNLPKKTFTVVFSAIDISWTDKKIDESGRRTKDLIVSADRNGFILDRSKTDAQVMEAFYAYPKQVLLYPDLKKLPEYKKVLAFPPESFEGKLIQQVKSTNKNIIQIPFEKRVIITKAKDEISHLTLLLKIVPGEKTEAVQKNLVFFGGIESETYSHDIRMEKALSKEKNYFISQVNLPVMPGLYTLVLGFYTQDKKTYSIKMDQIEVPDFWNKKLALSPLLASSQVQERQVSTKGGEFDVFSLGQYALLPRFSQEYTRDEFLNVFYYIYNVAVDQSQNCSLLIEFELKKGEKIFNLNPQHRRQKLNQGASLLEGTQIPLSALPESGEYELTVRVTDEVTKETAQEKLKFHLL